MMEYLYLRMINHQKKKIMHHPSESLDELMAQFRQLENHQSTKNDTLLSDHDGISSPTSLPERGIHYRSSCTSSGWPNFSWKQQSTWYPYLLVLGGLFLFVTILTAIFRPRFLFSNEEEKFMWKRYFLTVFVTYLLLLGALYGLYYYAMRLSIVR